MKKMSVSSLTSTAMLLCLAIVLNFLEGLLPVLPGLPPGVKLGLSNIVVVYCIFFLGAPKAFLIAFLKSVFVLLTRGVSAGWISLCGGLLSVLVMLMLSRAKSSVTLLSVFGAISHNFGQLIAAYAVMQTTAVFYYFPVLLVSGIVMGLVTAVMVRVTLPALRRIGGSKTT